ncbi:ankyrin repeat domain-containing protein [Candidatus Cardinium hertigii]|uniref:ankyrin repeat domain-containing protein n=1 Tax=Candidatus Cardinium hertigii TaxID=247481 RepID=UPI003D7C419E
MKKIYYSIVLLSSVAAKCPSNHTSNTVLDSNKNNESVLKHTEPKKKPTNVVVENTDVGDTLSKKEASRTTLPQNAKSEQNDIGFTKLHHAAQKGHLSEVIKLLKATDIQVNARGKKGCTPLHIAAVCGHTEVVTQLVKVSGIEVNAKDENGSTPLHYALGHNFVKVIKVLLKAKGIDINTKDNDGRTPLITAVGHGNQVEVIKALLETKGIDINAKNNDGNTALDVAKKDGYEACVNVLKEALKRQK